MKPERLTGTVFEDKRRKDAILKRLEFLAPVLENLPHTFYVINASDYVICLTNSAHADSGESSAGITCHALLHQRDKPCALEGYPCPVETVKETKKPFRSEHLHQDPESGKDRVVEIHAFPIFNRGKVSQIVEHCVDITWRRQAEAAIRSSEPKLVGLSNELLETNKALVVMARNFDRSREEVEKAVARAISSKIMPIIHDLQNDRRLEGCRTELGMVATYLNDMVSNLTKGTGITGPLSATETKVVVMAKNGMKSFEIANHLHIALETVKTHRKNIRKKLGIQNSNLNLFTYLSSQLPAHDEPIVNQWGCRLPNLSPQEFHLENPQKKP
jgi:hypothetical protein